LNQKGGKMKTKIFSILLAMTILTLGIGATALAAPAKLPSADFQLYCGGNACFVGWVEGTTILAKDAEITWANWGHQYKVFIPKGTEVTGYPWQEMNIYKLELTVMHYPAYTYICLSPVTLKFSQPVTVSELIDGKWSTVLSFSQVQNGTAY
jgi:hypothetical protein